MDLRTAPSLVFDSAPEADFWAPILLRLIQR